jgi:hypothetical protein
MDIYVRQWLYSLRLGIFIPERCGDTWRFGVHPILSNFLKYSFSKILCHDKEFLI